ncbi:sensor histidine kinase [Actinoplanes sp. NBRC 103695]|uniref:sensor histidine kinase n=1 Tax=Actinoplanes sp. NBRC 103695 TaxID=3032202 RepID=UPI00249FB839|nr:sensor histidine kinase [Actinoplanes sp. NBRC 103695]GLZ02171.1 hypothetical protein Acsp02_94220 [Actinoplanes sp. NBRC 103695]
MAVVLPVVLGMVGAAAWFAPPLESTGSPGGLMLTSAVLVTVAAVLGGTVRAHGRHLARLRELTTREAVARERLHIARELHDAVAHRMSVIALQAGVANYVVDEQPDEARRALLSIEETSRTGLRELRSLLGVLRTGSPAAGAEDDRRLGVASLDALVVPFRAAGLQVPVVVTGVARPLSPAVDASAYRIVQEALTNVVRHAGATRADVVIDYAADSVEVRVTDNGSGSRKADRSDGHGILGMRERVGMVGGELSVGPVPTSGGGFRVSARLPLAEARA